jgi:hypothetical protein
MDDFIIRSAVVMSIKYMNLVLFRLLILLTNGI